MRLVSPSIADGCVSKYMHTRMCVYVCFCVLKGKAITNFIVEFLIVCCRSTIKVEWTGQDMNNDDMSWKIDSKAFYTLIEFRRRWILGLKLRNFFQLLSGKSNKEVYFGRKLLNRKIFQIFLINPLSGLKEIFAISHLLRSIFPNFNHSVLKWVANFWVAWSKLDLL